MTTYFLRVVYYLDNPRPTTAMPGHRARDVHTVTQIWSVCSLTGILPADHRERCKHRCCKPLQLRCGDKVSGAGGSATLRWSANENPRNCKNTKIDMT
jgi:hypothetical protein